MKSDHPDYFRLRPISEEVIDRFGGNAALESRFPEIIKDALDYVIDPVRTGRTKVSELDSIEKTFIGLKVEHFLRHELDVPAGVRDLEIAGEDVDIKNTVRKTWMIPPESFRNQDPCLLIMTATDEGLCSFGIIIAKPEYLTKPNRDGKRAVSALGKKNIMWLLKEAPLPRSRFEGIDMERFRELRMMRGGNKRVLHFCRENVGRIIHREVFEALLHDQKDPMKRLRNNGGANELLADLSLQILSGMYGADKIKDAKHPSLSLDEFICIEIK